MEARESERTAPDDDFMFSAKLTPKMIEGAEIAELRDSVRVLSEVIRHLAERVEILETRETLGRFRAIGA
jgi:hypothetical protein